jgi:hypothetical protein
MEIRTAALNGAQFQRLAAMEARLGARLVALQEVEELAPLAEDQAERISWCEGECGVILLAYKKNEGAEDVAGDVGWNVAPALTLASLEQDQERDLRALERELGVIVLAYRRESDGAYRAEP